jgi:ABC-type amino acid transport substrate-binding protein
MTPITVLSRICANIFLTFAIILGIVSTAFCRDLDEVKKEGVLRHIGVPYANFVTGSGDGMDVELMQLFAKQIGVRYEYVKSSWDTVVPDLIGKTVKPNGDNVELLEPVPVKGDVVANGFTILNWREKILDFSRPTFPTQIILLAKANSSLKPIKPSGDMNKDISRTKKLTSGKTCIGVKGTCLDPDLYNLQAEGAITKNFTGALDDISVAVIKGEAETAVMEIPDALISLKKHPGKLKIIGPLSPMQEMGAGFARDAPKLRSEFNKFLAQSKKDGSYLRIVKKYYPSVIGLYPAFFK